MAAGSLVTGNMDYLRRPFVRNVKRGHRVLVISDTSHDARVWQVVQSIPPYDALNQRCWPPAPGSVPQRAQASKDGA